MSYFRPRFPAVSAVCPLPLLHGTQAFFRRRKFAFERTFSNHKRAAIGALLLASFLEVCGCNPVEDRQRTTPRELLLLSQEDASVPRSLAVEESNAKALVDEQSLSFYDPGGTVTENPFTETPPTSLAPFPIEVKYPPLPIPESVFFIYKNMAPGGSEASRVSIASAFILSVQDRAHKQVVRFLVTARHIVDPEWAHCSEKNPASIGIRLNKRNGGVGFESIPLVSGRKPRFFTPSDPTSDLAAMILDRRLIPDIDDYKLLDVPFRLLPTDAEVQSIQTEQQITTAGLLTIAAPYSYPAYDPGVVSRMPSKSVNVRCSSSAGPNPLHLWFITASLPQGVSGAPVYTSMVRDAGGAKSPVLLGIQSVAWPTRGVAGITPAAVLGDLVVSALKGNKLAMDFHRGAMP